MRLIVAGSRDITNYKIVHDAMLEFERRHGPITQVISGCARGPDTTGAALAEAMGIVVLRMPADWEQYGKAAGPIRNNEMAKIADALLAFWDGNSRGTKNMIDLSAKYDLTTMVVEV